MKRCFLLACFLGLLAPGCGDDGKKTVKDDINEVPDCYENPMTHVEIINACTDAEQIDKNPVLPLLNEDGSLPDLP